MIPLPHSSWKSQIYEQKEQRSGIPEKEEGNLVLYLIGGEFHMWPMKALVMDNDDNCTTKIYIVKMR